MNQLNYWVSNKGRLHDVDFTKATLTDVDFRGGIDLSTTKFPTDYKPGQSENPVGMLNLHS